MRLLTAVMEKAAANTTTRRASLSRAGSVNNCESTAISPTGAARRLIVTPPTLRACVKTLPARRYRTSEGRTIAAGTITAAIRAATAIDGLTTDSRPIATAKDRATGTTRAAPGSLREVLRTHI